MTEALRRVIERAAKRRLSTVERCGMCAGVIDAQHRHVWDGHDENLLCVCTPCSLLFDRDAAGGDRYRLIPTRRVRLSTIRAADLSAAGLAVPVGLACFVKREDGQVWAHYPGPLGVTGASVDTTVWRALETRFPILAGLAARVEAFLMWTRDRSPATGEASLTERSFDRGGDEYWLVPLDDCYRLTATLRRHWRGMTGGAVWREVAAFFHELAQRAEGAAPCDRVDQWSTTPAPLPDRSHAPSPDWVQNWSNA